MSGDMPLFRDRVRALADQTAQSADDRGDAVTVGRDEWFALMDAIYDEGWDDDATAGDG